MFALSQLCIFHWKVVINRHYIDSILILQFICFATSGLAKDCHAKFRRFLIHSKVSFAATEKIAPIFVFIVEGCLLNRLASVEIRKPSSTRMDSVQSILNPNRMQIPIKLPEARRRWMVHK